jgi:serine/threonine protein kinase
MSGHVFIDRKAIDEELGKILTQAEIIRLTGLAGKSVSSHTAANAFYGRRMKVGTAARVVRATKLPKPERFLIAIEDGQTPQEAVFPESYGNWDVTEDDFEHRLLRDIPFSIGKTVNRVDHRVGRIKRFNILKFNDEDFDTVKEEVARHPIVCGKLERHPSFPLYYDSQFHGRRSFWVIEKWEDGVTLDEHVKSDGFNKSEVPRIAIELAHALNALNKVEVVRRELTPETILVRDTDKSLVLFDFETATFAYDTYSREMPWKRDPYLAREVAAPDVDVRADLFSWAQVVIFCLTGRKPQETYKPDFFAKLAVPESVMQALSICTQFQRDSRVFGTKASGTTTDFDGVLRLIEDWKGATETK